MAKVIKHGNLYNKEITCKRCGCVFIPEKEDIHYPKIDVDNIPDDGEVHLDDLKDVKGLPSKNKLDRFFISAEMYDIISLEIECPECGETKTFDNELVVFDFFGNEGDLSETVWVTDDKYLQLAIHEDYFDDDSPAWNVERMLVEEGLYECLQLDVKRGQYRKVKIPVMRPDIESHKDIYEHIKEIVTKK